jgi:hypothetical protein
MKDPIRTAKGKGSIPIPTDNAAGWAPDRHEPQAPEDRPAKGYANDTPKGWLRGSNEDATTKPGFDHSGPSGFRFDKTRK